MKKIIRYLLPVWFKKILKYILYSIQDSLDFILRTKDFDYPPRRLNFVGSHDFKKVGDEFVELFQNTGELKPGNSVLDIGCGIGRMAIPLAKYLNKKGSYEGFDIDYRGVEWCVKNITPKHSNFHFQYVDIYNKFYNQKGKTLAKNFKFPYEDDSFDFIFATSVFTHMLPGDIENYLKEIKRVLKPEGRTFLTWFTLNSETQKLMEEGASTANFQYQKEECFYSHKTNIEAETAYREKWVKDLYKKDNLDKNFKIHPGWWRGKEGTSYQDIIVSKNKTVSLRG